MPYTVARLRESALPRRVDRVLGSPLLRLIAAVRRRREMPRDFRHIGIMVFETIGDSLLAGTIIASLRASFPRVRVTVFGSQGNAGALALIDGIDQVVSVPLTQPLAAMRAVRSVPVDVMIDVGQWPRWYALLCALSRSRHTIGFATPGQARHFAFDTVVAHRRDVHEVENFQALLRPLGDVTPVAPARALRRAQDAPLGLVPSSPFVVFHPWAGGFNSPAREWPHAHWVELARRVSEAGYAVLVSGAPADEARAAEFVEACAGVADVRSISGRCDLPALAAVLRRASAAVCVNTGVMHLAALLDVPLVALHGPTSRLRWGPVGAHAIALAPAGPDCEFLHLGFEYPAHAVASMARIEVDEVMAALHRLLPATNDRRGAR
jgi:ADP-heptose:LPS heptosyltransferase